MASESSHILAVKATFDGQRIVLPKETQGIPPGNVIVIFEDSIETEDRTRWLKAQETACAKAWDNSEDEIYDRM